MAKRRIITVKGPLGGVVRKTDFQSQQPYTAVDAKNTLPVDLVTGRRRVAVRPRLETIATGPNSPTLPAVRALAEVNVATSQLYERALLAIAGGKVYRLTTGPAWTDHGGSLTSTRWLSTATYLNVLYIADGSTPSQFTVATTTLATMSATAGSIPSNVTIVTEWNGRLVWTGDSSSPHVWYMSAQGAPRDYDYGTTNETGAVSATSIEGGVFSERLTALIAHNRQCLIFGATDAMYIIRGDPMQGGRFEVISQVVGPISQSAWCRTPEDATVLWTRDGIYLMAPGCGSTPAPISEKKIPGSLKGIDTATFECFVGYDVRFRGVHLYKTGASNSESWWLDWDDGGFWPLDLTATEQPRSVLRFDPLEGANVSGTLLGGAGGSVRRLDGSSTTSLSNGYVRIGPIRISATPFHRATIRSMNVRFGSNTNATHLTTGGVVNVYVGKDGEDVWAAVQAGTAGKKYQVTIGNLANNWICQPDLEGHACIIEVALGSDGTKHWSLEEISLEVEESGVLRP